MKIGNRQSNENTKIVVQIKKINDGMIDCKHIMSGFQVKAYIHDELELQVGQIVQLEYRRNAKVGGGYIVINTLMEEIEANVIEAQHIIAEGKMYTSLILENPNTHKRLHSLIPNTSELFSETSIIITGDKVKIKLNNGKLFSIQI